MKITKVLSIIMAIALLLSVATVAFAANDGSITVKSAANGESYTIYKLFDLSFSGSNYSYTLAANSPWKTFFTSGNGTKYVEIASGTNVVTWKNNASAANLAEDAIAYAKENKATIQGTSKTGTGADLIFNGLSYGYYLVDSTMGALCSLDTTRPNVDIDEKNTTPSITKQVQEDSNNAWVASNDAAIGETVNYQAEISIGKGAELITMHDKMDAGLSFGRVSGISVNGTQVAATNYTVKTSCNDGCTFEIEFNKAYITTLAENTKLLVEYTATVNANAVIGSTGNKNEAKIIYGENNSVSNIPTTTTYVWEFDVFKYAGTDTSKTALANATFTLSQDGTQLAFTKIADNQYKLDANGTVREFTTDASGKMKFIGLDSGSYQLTETVAPTGYNKLANPINVTISNTGAVTPATPDMPNTVQVKNESGNLLPDTGSIGTVIFYVVGGVLFVAALVLLITKKRMSQAQ